MNLAANLSPAPLSLEEIEETRRLLAPHVLRTPVHTWAGREIESRIEGTQINVKLELLQHAGSFKARGALSVALRLSKAALERGVTAVSAGNHAIATAFAARKVGASAKVVMIASANPARIEACRAYGAQVLLSPDGRQAFELAARIEREEGRTFMHPFEGPLTALGAATLGVEWLEQAGALDAVVLPVGGGGLCAGVASAVKLLQPDCQVFGVEPAGADTMSRSFAAGSPQSRSDVSTIADSLAPPYALPYSFALCRRNVDELVLVDDDQIRAAMALMFRELKLAPEPACAVATAGLLGPLRERLAGRRVGIVACGANIDIESFAAHVRAAAP